MKKMKVGHNGENWHVSRGNNESRENQNGMKYSFSFEANNVDKSKLKCFIFLKTSHFKKNCLERWSQCYSV